MKKNRFTEEQMVSARVRRLQLAYVVQRGRSGRRACALLSIARSTVKYQCRMTLRDAPLIEQMRELAGSVRNTDIDVFTCSWPDAVIETIVTAH